MSVADYSNAVPGTVGTIIKVGMAVTDAINSAIGGTGLTKEQRAAVDAARAAGYRQTRTGWVAPDGGRVLQSTVINAGRQQIIAAGPSNPNYRPDLTERVARRPATRTADQASRLPKIPGKYGRIISTVGTIAAGSTVGGYVTRGIDELLRRGANVEPPPPAPIPQPPPTVTQPGYASPQEIAGGGAVFAQPGGRTRPAPVPKRPASTPIDTTPPLTSVPVYTPYLPIPAAAPAPVPSTVPSGASSSTTARTVLGMSPAQLAGLALPTLLALLNTSSNSKRRDPLSGIPNVGGNPLLGFQPGAYPLPNSGGSWLTGGSGSTGLCDCAPKRKARGEKKRRTVCYSGTFRERASGLSKVKKRRVSCQ